MTLGPNILDYNRYVQGLPTKTLEDVLSNPQKAPQLANYLFLVPAELNERKRQQADFAARQGAQENAGYSSVAQELAAGEKAPMSRMGATAAPPPPGTQIPPQSQLASALAGFNPQGPQTVNRLPTMTAQRGFPQDTEAMVAQARSEVGMPSLYGTRGGPYGQERDSYERGGKTSAPPRGWMRHIQNMIAKQQLARGGRELVSPTMPLATMRAQDSLYPRSYPLPEFYPPNVPYITSPGVGIDRMRNPSTPHVRNTAEENRRIAEALIAGQSAVAQQTVAGAPPSGVMTEIDRATVPISRDLSPDMSLSPNMNLNIPPVPTSGSVRDVGASQVVLPGGPPIAGLDAGAIRGFPSTSVQLPPRVDTPEMLKVLQAKRGESWAPSIDTILEEEAIRNLPPAEVPQGEDTTKIQRFAPAPALEAGPEIDQLRAIDASAIADLPIVDRELPGPKQPIDVAALQDGAVEIVDPFVGADNTQLQIAKLQEIIAVREKAKETAVATGADLMAEATTKQRKRLEAYDEQYNKDLELIQTTKNEATADATKVEMRLNAINAFAEGGPLPAKLRDRLLNDVMMTFGAALLGNPTIRSAAEVGFAQVPDIVKGAREKYGEALSSMLDGTAKVVTLNNAIRANETDSRLALTKGRQAFMQGNQAASDAWLQRAEAYNLNIRRADTAERNADAQLLGAYANLLTAQNPKLTAVERIVNDTRTAMFQQGMAIEDAAAREAFMSGRFIRGRDGQWVNDNVHGRPDFWWPYYTEFERSKATSYGAKLAGSEFEREHGAFTTAIYSGDKEDKWGAITKYYKGWLKDPKVLAMIPEDALWWDAEAGDVRGGLAWQADFAEWAIANGIPAYVRQRLGEEHPIADRDVSIAGVSAGSPAGGGVFTKNANGTFTYTPAP